MFNLMTDSTLFIYDHMASDILQMTTYVLLFPTSSKETFINTITVEQDSYHCIEFSFPNLETGRIINVSHEQRD